MCISSIVHIKCKQLIRLTNRYEKKKQSGLFKYDLKTQNIYELPVLDLLP